MNHTAWKLFDAFYLLIEQAWVSWVCWALGAQRDAAQRADARMAALLVA